MAKVVAARSRNFVFTENNYNDEGIAMFANIGDFGAKYVAYAKEVGAEGTPHLQGFVSFGEAKTISAVKKYAAFARAHVEIMKGTIQESVVYCSKGVSVENPLVEHGVRPATAVEKGKAEKDRWQLIKEQAVAGKFDEVEPKVLVQNVSALLRIQSLFQPVLKISVHLSGLWFRGVAGSGKTTSVNALWPEAYDVSLETKFLELYKGEPYMWVDDIEMSHTSYLTILKRVPDHKPYRWDVKCNQGVYVRPKVFVVTSQFSIDEIWTGDKARVALNRRYHVVDFPLENNTMFLPWWCEGTIGDPSKAVIPFRVEFLPKPEAVVPVVEPPVSPLVLNRKRKAGDELARAGYAYEPGTGKEKSAKEIAGDDGYCLFCGGEFPCLTCLF